MDSFTKELGVPMIRSANSFFFEVSLLAAVCLSACGDGNLSGNTSGTKGRALGVTGVSFSAESPEDPNAQSIKDNKISPTVGDVKPELDPTLGTKNTNPLHPDPTLGAGGAAPADPQKGGGAITQVPDPALNANKNPIVTTAGGGDGTIDSADWRVGDGLRKCLNGWGPKSPFNGSSSYRKISASISILSLGNSVNDTDVTDAPELVVLVAGVNLASLTRYRFLNPNGWYCIIADVNLATRLNVDLHTKAHLADSRVAVNILSATNNQTANLNVNVLSSVNVNRVNF